MCKTMSSRMDYSGKDKYGEHRSNHNTSLCHTYHLQQLGEVIPTEEQSDDLNATLKRLWDLETMGIILLRSVMTSDESVAWP